MTRIKIYFSVRVVIPNDMQLVRLINRTIQHVVLQGPIFEAMLMDKESNNPMFQFLFDYTCPAHTYYRSVKKSFRYQEIFIKTFKVEIVFNFEWREPDLLANAKISNVRRWASLETSYSAL